MQILRLCHARGAGRHGMGARSARGARSLNLILYRHIVTVKRSYNMKNIQKYDSKIIVSGNMFEVYFYDIEQVKKMITDDDTEQKINESNTEFDENNEKEIDKSSVIDEKDRLIKDTKYKRLPRSAQRSKKKLERLIFANIGQYEEKDKFITLTFKENVDRDKLLFEFKNFIRRLKRQYGKDFEYIAVIERGTRGQEKLHLHCIFFNLPYVKNSYLRKIWGNGFVKINAFETEQEIVSYMIKYVEKTLTDDSYVGKGKKFYFTSQNLKKPIESYCSLSEAVNMINGYENIFPDKVALCDFEFDSVHVGKCRYIKINNPKVKRTKNITDDEIEFYNEMLKADSEFY